MNSCAPGKARCTVTGLAALLIGCVVNQAGANDAFADGLFRRGQFEASLINACLLSPALPAANRSKVGYTLTELQIGWMLSDPSGPVPWRGNWEIVAGGFGGAVLQGRGNYLSGLTVWLRHNFVPRGFHLIPYVQGGAGLTETDIDRRLVGQNLNFNLDLAGGARYLLSSRWSLSFEYRFQHTSNATLSHHDLGMNAHGAAFGVSCRF